MQTYLICNALETGILKGQRHIDSHIMSEETPETQISENQQENFLLVHVGVTVNLLKGRARNISKDIKEVLLKLEQIKSAW